MRWHFRMAKALAMHPRLHKNETSLRLPPYGGCGAIPVSACSPFDPGTKLSSDRKTTGDLEVCTVTDSRQYRNHQLPTVQYLRTYLRILYYHDFVSRLRDTCIHASFISGRQSTNQSHNMASVSHRLRKCLRHLFLFFFGDVFISIYSSILQQAKRQL